MEMMVTEMDNRYTIARRVMTMMTTITRSLQKELTRRRIRRMRLLLSCLVIACQS